MTGPSKFEHEDPVYSGYPLIGWRRFFPKEESEETIVSVFQSATPAESTRAPRNPAVKRRTGASSRINADNIWLYRFIAIGVIAGALSAFATSWTGLLYVAGWQALPVGWEWLTPVMIDIPIVVLSLGALAKRSRGENQWWFLAFAIFLTALSSAANFAHTVSVNGLNDYTNWIGASLNGLAPAFVLLTTEVLGSLVTRPIAKKK